MIVINPDIGKVDADPSRIPAFITGDTVVFWDSLSKDLARAMWQHGFSLLSDYDSDTVGSCLGATLLGALDDLYPEWISEFEA